ncbi:ATP-binding cassette domain-containing protein [Solirubrobacter sp. CPCC 204708]|nr:ATP-binding cassette domain-containing protein [Solirubrobacter deserti]MBE2320871.1 ATP-binding cassette domain-containing protein [Solirubrobacter deserti]
MPAPLVEAAALELRFGHRAVLSGIDLCVGAGQVHGLIGPCGAGKSVLLRVLSGELAPTGGVARAQDVVLVADAAASPLLLAQALAGNPSVLLVDEPSAGFSSEARAAVRSLVVRHTARGGAAVWATRRLDALHRLASDVTLLAGGRVRYAGSVEVLVLRSLAQSAEDVADEISRAA